jgi:hypothetical protein
VASPVAAAPRPAPDPGTGARLQQLMVIAFVTPIPAYMILYALVRDNPALVAGVGSGLMSASPDGAFRLVRAVSAGFNDQGVEQVP